MNLSAENFLEAFQGLTRLLSKHRPLWGKSAFVNDDLAWREQYPHLYSELLALTDETVMSLSDEDALLEYLTSHLPELGELANWRMSSEDGPRWQTPKRALFGLPGRKKRQIEGFVSALLPLLGRSDAEVAEKTKIVDWCSGRGLLARQLHYAGRAPVLCFDHDPELCRSGRIAHNKMDADMSEQVLFNVQDVLGSIDSTDLENAYLHTALHACGDLHIAMLAQAADARARVIACSPCCYHLTESEVYLGLSREGRRSGLEPTKDQLRLATAESTTANALQRELRQRELLWRVAFDLHLRDLSGVEEYCPMPSVKKSLLKGTVGEFLESMMTAVRKKGCRTVSFAPLSEREEIDLLSRAGCKIAVIKRLEKAQLGFRRALEYWLLLDRALFLQEQGYRVELREFCQKQDSGRNIVILASRVEHSGGSAWEDDKIPRRRAGLSPP